MACEKTHGREAGFARTHQSKAKTLGPGFRRDDEVGGFRRDDEIGGLSPG
jgi:hypothetical protein